MKPNNKAQDLDKTIVYHPTTNEAFVVDMDTKVLKKIEFEDEGQEYGLKAKLKTPGGAYRTEVRQYCKRLYLGGVSPTEISKRTGVDFAALSRWVYGVRADDPKSWKVLRKKELDELKERNAEAYVGVERQVLEKIADFLKQPEAVIKDTRQLKDYAEVLDKLLSPGAAKSGATKGPLIQINQSVQPLSPEEARKIIHDDPIRLLEVETTENDTADDNNAR